MVIPLSILAAIGFAVGALVYRDAVACDADRPFLWGGGTVVLTAVFLVPAGMQRPGVLAVPTAFVLHLGLRFGGRLGDGR